MKLSRHIPNVFTVANLICGSIAAVMVATSYYHTNAILLIFLAAFFDLLDGAIARALHVSGELGKQLDSLADVVSFGLVPSVVIFKLLEESLPVEYANLRYLAFLNVAAAAIRLARFNISTDQKHDFSGMPSPANGLFWASVLVCYKWMIDAAIAPSLTLISGFAVLMLVVTSYLMIANIRMFSFKFLPGGIKANLIPYLFIVVVVITTLLSFFLVKSIIPAIPVCILLYILMSFAYHVMRKAV